MRPARRRFIRALSAGLVLGALLTSLLPVLPVVARGPVKVVGREVETTVDHQRVVPLPINASHVALRWRDAHDAHDAHEAEEPELTVAFANRPNEFGEDVLVGHSEEPDEDGQTYGAVLWTGGARFVRITTDRPLGRVTVIAINAQADKGYEDGGIAVANAATTQPSIIKRAAWGADESLRFDSGGHETWPPSFSPMQKAIVHHTAGRNGDPNPAATVRAIYYMYAISRDYGDIGYNFLIDEQGRIYEGRYSRPYASGETPTGEDLSGNVVRGAHARDFNDGNVGIVLLGTFMNRQPSSAARNSLERLLAWKLERHALNPLGQSVYVNPVLGHTKLLNNISGHRNVNPTACPGDTFYPTFPQLRQNVANRIAATTGAGNDTSPPTVKSLIAMATNPTGSPTIPFGLTFNEPVTGLESSDFELDGSSDGWSVGSITGTGATYTVNLVADDPEDGTVQLTLPAGAVTDSAGLAGPADPATAAAAYAFDEVAPTVLLYHSPHKTYHNSTKLDYFDVTATFSEPVTGFEPSDIALAGTAHSASPWKVPMIFGSGANYGFSVANAGWVSGTLRFQIPEGAVHDLAGNPVQASNLVSVVLDKAAPSNTAPRTSLRAGTTLDGADLRVALTWSGSDAGPAGIASYDVARSRDGSAFKVIATGVTQPTLSKTLKLGHTYRFEVRARDKAGNVGAWKAAGTIRPALIQQTNGSVRWAGSTRTTFLSRYSGGSQRYLAEAGSFVKFKTTARSISFITTRDPNRGAARIYIDGVYQTTVDLYAASTTFRYVAFTKTWATARQHTIKVVAVGTDGRKRVDVDAFGVIR
jgi:chitodextrinase